MGHCGGGDGSSCYPGPIMTGEWRGCEKRPYCGDISIGQHEGNKSRNVLFLFIRQEQTRRIRRFRSVKVLILAV